MVKSLAFVLAGCAVYAFTFYSISGLSAFGFGAIGSPELSGRPEFYGREFVPGFGGLIGTTLIGRGIIRVLGEDRGWRTGIGMCTIGVGAVGILWVVLMICL